MASTGFEVEFAEGGSGDLCFHRISPSVRSAQKSRAASSRNPGRMPQLKLWCDCEGFVSGDLAAIEFFNCKMALSLGNRARTLRHG